MAEAPTSVKPGRKSESVSPAAKGTWCRVEGLVFRV